MVRSKHLGLLVLVGSILLMAAYALAVACVRVLMLQLTALTVVLGMFGLLAWISYAMLTELPGYSKVQPLKDWWSIVSPLILLFLGARN